ncbi:Uncharacterised protein [Vibrio cholerae]|nr:Uncharacterised protein [Vibrio cholerae]
MALYTHSPCKISTLITRLPMRRRKICRSSLFSPPTTSMSPRLGAIANSNHFGKPMNKGRKKSFIGSAPQGSNMTSALNTLF